MTGGELVAVITVVSAVMATTEPGQDWSRRAWKSAGGPQFVVRLKESSAERTGRVVAGTARTAAKPVKAPGRVARWWADRAESRWQRRGGPPATTPVVWRAVQPSSLPEKSGLLDPTPPAGSETAPVGPANPQEPHHPDPPAAPVPSNQEDPMQPVPNNDPTPAAGHGLNLERPATDGEFLDSCHQLGELLTQIANDVEEWGTSVKDLGLPATITGYLDGIADGITDAAESVNRAAAAFEDEFEDARGVAAKGMTITGQDAA